MESSIPFITLGNLVDAEGITDENDRNLDLPLENKNVIPKLESQNFPLKPMSRNPKSWSHKQLIRLR